MSYGKRKGRIFPELPLAGLEPVLKDLCRGEDDEKHGDALLTRLADAAVAAPLPPDAGPFDADWGDWLDQVLELGWGRFLAGPTKEELRVHALQVGPRILFRTPDLRDDWRVLGAASLRAACDEVPVLILADALSHLGTQRHSRIIREALGSPSREIREWGMVMVPTLRSHRARGM